MTDHPTPRPPTQPHRPSKRRRIADFALIAALLGLLAFWLSYTPPGILGKLDAIGYAVCHRIEERSFAAYGHHLPLCARCTGQYLGAMMVGLYALVTRRTSAALFPPRRVFAVLVLFLIAWGLDGLNSYLHLFPGYEGPYAPNNALRLLTGSLQGLAMGNFFVPLFNQTVWWEEDKRSITPGLRHLAGQMIAIFAFDMLILMDLPAFVMAAGVLSAVTVGGMLVLLHTLVVIVFGKREARAMRWRDMWRPLLAGALLALITVTLIDVLRFLWTGTWGGFPIPPLG